MKDTNVIKRLMAFLMSIVATFTSFIDSNLKGGIRMNTKATRKMRSLTAFAMALAMVFTLFGGISFAPVTAYADNEDITSDITIMVSDGCEDMNNTTVNNYTKNEYTVKENVKVKFQCGKWWPNAVTIYLNGSAVAVWSGNADYSSSYTWTAGKNAKINWAGYSQDSANIYLTQAVTYNVTVADSIANGTVTADKASAAEGDTVTLTVTPADDYELDTLTVTYADEGTVTATQDLTDSSKYTFTMPAKNVTVNATFKAATSATYTVSFAAGTGASGTMADVTGVSGEYTLPACTFTAPSGKEFAGWKVGDATTATAAGQKINVTANVTLTATWQPATYTVTFNSNGGSAVASQTVDVGGKATKPANPTYGNLTFLGWFVNPTLDNIFNPETYEYNTFDFNSVLTGNVTLKALWGTRANVNTEGLGQIAGSVAPEEPVFDEYPITSISEMAIIGLIDSFKVKAKPDTGYRFVKWEKEVGEDEYVDYSTDNPITVTVTEPISLRAVFEEIKYPITYHLDGGTDSGNENEYSQAYGYEVVNPTKDGYAFVGWTTVAGGLNPIMNYKIPSGTTGAVNLYANWKSMDEVKGTVETNVKTEVIGATSSNFEDTLESEVGTVGAQQYIKAELTVEENEFPASELEEKVNNIFAGASSANIQTTYLEIDITKYITTVSNEGTETDWDRVSDMKKPVELEFTLSSLGYSDVPENIAVIRDHEGTNKVFDKLTSKPDTTSMSDGTFWVDTENEKIFIYSQYFSTFAITSTTETLWTVTLDVNGGNALTQSVYYVANNATLTLPIPTKAGSYTFAGWYTAVTGGTKVTDTTPITSDMTLYAHWTYTGGSGGSGGGGGYSGPTYYTVSFNTNSGSTVANQSVVSGGKVTKPVDPTKSGYTFDGWYTDNTLTTAFDFNTAIYSSRTLYAKWKDNSGNGEGGNSTPTIVPTPSPTANVTTPPTSNPIASPTADTTTPTTNPTADVTATPTENPTIAPTANPTEEPTANPTVEPTAKPTSNPTNNPTVSPSSSPKATLAINSGLKVSQTGKKITVKWGKVDGATSYEVYVAYCGQKMPTKATVTTTKNSVSIKKLNGKKINLKKNFKVYVVAKNGTAKLAKTITAHVVGCKNAKYTNAKSIKITTKTKLTLKKGKTSQIKAKTVLVDSKKKQLSDKHAKEFRYASSNKDVAIVSKNGKIKAKNKGTAVIYVYSRNGYAKKIKVTVK